MKKIVWIVAFIAVVLLVAPFGIGKLAEKRIDDGLDRLVLQAPYLSVSERKYHGGWFSSDEDVTFELFGGFGMAGPEGAPKFTVHNVIHHGPLLGATLGLARVESHVVLDPKIRAQLKKNFGSEEPYEITTYYGFFGGGTLVLSADAGKSKT